MLGIAESSDYVEERRAEVFRQSPALNVWRPRYPFALGTFKYIASPKILFVIGLIPRNSKVKDINIADVSAHQIGSDPALMIYLGSVPCATSHDDGFYPLISSAVVKSDGYFAPATGFFPV